MKARVPFQPTSKQKKIFRDEIRKEVIDMTARYDIDFEAMIAWTLHKHFGFGLVRLLRFRKAFMDEYKELKQHYQMEGTYPARYLLKNNVGYDIEKIMKEDKENAED